MECQFSMDETNVALKTENSHDFKVIFLEGIF